MAQKPTPEFREPVQGGVIGPAPPERLKPFTHRAVGTERLRLVSSTDNIADEAVYRRHDPRVVPCIPPGPPRHHGRAHRDRRAQPSDGPRTLPMPPATRSVDAASAREAEKAMEEGPNGRENGPKPTLKLLEVFMNPKKRHSVPRGLPSGLCLKNAASRKSYGETQGIHRSQEVRSSTGSACQRHGRRRFQGISVFQP